MFTEAKIFNTVCHTVLYRDVNLKIIVGEHSSHHITTCHKKRFMRRGSTIFQPKYYVTEYAV